MILADEPKAASFRYSKNTEAASLGTSVFFRPIVRLPLLLIVTLVAAWIGSFAGRFDFDKADKHISQRDGEIGARLERGER
jgi:hypothetical protein